jgi:hypothetical protein
LEAVVRVFRQTPGDDRREVSGCTGPQFGDRRREFPQFVVDEREEIGRG